MDFEDLPPQLQSEYLGSRDQIDKILEFTSPRQMIRIWFNDGSQHKWKRKFNVWERAAVLDFVVTSLDNRPV